MESILQLAHIVLSDPLPAAVPNVVYLYTTSDDLRESVLARAVELYNSHEISIALLSGKGGGYSGYEVWKDELIKRGVLEHHIFSVPGPTILNTYAETEALIECCQTNKWKSIFICTAPFHQLRAFITAVSHAEKICPELKIYNTPGKSIPWHRQVSHYQGMVVDTPFNLILSEHRRIQTSYAQQDLISTEDVIEYLRRRDAQPHY
jgi:hypothetical protein